MGLRLLDILLKVPHDYKSVCKLKANHFFRVLFYHKPSTFFANKFPYHLHLLMNIITVSKSESSVVQHALPTQFCFYPHTVYQNTCLSQTNNYEIVFANGLNLTIFISLRAIFTNPIFLRLSAICETIKFVFFLFSF